MGNVEKWVVLGVLALIVGILVVSLNVDDPLKKDKVVLEGTHGQPAPTVAADLQKPAPAVGAQPEAGKSTTPALLDSVVDTSAAAKPTSDSASAQSAPATLPIPAGSILKTTEGLQESFM